MNTLHIFLVFQVDPPRSVLTTLLVWVLICHNLRNWYWEPSRQVSVKIGAWDRRLHRNHWWRFCHHDWHQWWYSCHFDRPQWGQNYGDRSLTLHCLSRMRPHRTGTWRDSIWLKSCSLPEQAEVRQWTIMDWAYSPMGWRSGLLTIRFHRRSPWLNNFLSTVMDF